MRFRASSGEAWPALRVDDNVVSAPLGRALTATALGPVAVQANFLASLGVGVRESAGLLTVPAAVRIVDLANSPSFGKGLFAYMDIARGVFAGNLAAAGVAGGSLTWRGSPERFLMAGDDGRVLFTDNQVTLQVAEERSPGAFCSVGIFSLDDVGIDANQCLIDLQSGLVVVNLVAFGASLRVSDNRLSEGLPNAVLSGVTLGMMNMTTDNQATHCLLVRGWAGANLVVDQPNTVLENAISDGMCDRYVRVLEKFGTASFKG
jgi:hypothetical protein